MTSHAVFWDRIAEKYARQKIGNQEAYEASLARVVHWMRPDMSVLEIGCGTGTTALRLAGHAGRILGTDISREMVRIARDKAGSAGATHVDFAVSRADTAGAGAMFDMVTGFNILHLVDDLPGVLAHVHGVLPEGGLFVTKTPCLAGKPWFRPLIWVLQALGKAPKPVHFLSPAGLEAAIVEAGFEIVERGDYPPKLPSRFLVARKA